MLMRFILGVGLRAIAGAALGAAVGFWSGVQVGEWREASATASKVEVAERRIIKEIDDAGHEALARAIEARRRAERDWDRERELSGERGPEGGREAD